jgi:CHAT domain-containing protein
MPRYTSPDRRRTILPLVAATLLATFLLGIPAIAGAQITSVPHDGYFNGFGSYYDGDYRSAAASFRNAARAGIASTEGRWIDSICYHTMLGDCYYEMGDLTNALDQYSSALKLFVTYRDWMLRVEFPAGIDPEQNMVTNVTWGKSRRITRIGHFPPRFQSLQGQLNNQNALQRGGVVAAPSLHPVYVSEIVRCTAQSIRRRAEIMGPMSEHDTLTMSVLDALSRRPGPPNNWAQCWIELQLGCAYAAANKPDQAASELSKSLLAGGTYDHPLTCLGLVELGKLAFQQGKYEAAMTMFHEATISAAFFNRYDIMAEGFRWGQLAHLVSAQKGIYPPLVPAIAWSKQNGTRTLTVTLLTALGENLLIAGDVNGATATLALARSSLGRAEMAQGAMGAQLNFQTAKLTLQTGNIAAGATSLNAAINFQKAASKRAFQIALADRYFTSGGVTERVGDMLYAEVLREPTGADWTVEPLDTLASLMVPHPLPLEHWFELALVRKEMEQALEIADRIRRHRFFLSLPLGGRLHALRWVLEAPDESLTNAAQLQRQDLLVRFPRYQEISNQAAKAQTELATIPLKPADEAQGKKQAELLDQLGKLSAVQEALLQLIALQRVPSDFAFPPLLDLKQLRARLPEGRLVLAYLQTTRNVHAFAISKDNYAYFTVETPAKVRADVIEMLRLMGHYDKNQPLNDETLRDERWKASAAKILKQLTNNTKSEFDADDWAKYNEVVVIPDGLLWYLPFEALQLRSGTTTVSLIDLMNVRYVPTVALAAPDSRPRKAVDRTAVVAGRFTLTGDEVASTRAAAKIAEVLPGTTSLPTRLDYPTSIYASAFDRLVLLADVVPAEHGPYNLNPLQLEMGKPGNTLSDWMLLPWPSPDQIVMPGFHTSAEDSLKRGGNGEEVFLTVCGMMSTGARTILLSRWRVGGQSTFDLVREFVQELPHASAASAWRRSVQLGRKNPLDPAAEPRIKVPANVEAFRNEHPFFWAGYMLVDTGSEPRSDRDIAPPAVENK